MIIVGLVVAGACGAVLRYLVDHSVQQRMGSDFPLGILVVNVSGCLALGVLTGSALHHGLSGSGLTVAGTGFLGAYTTFSTFSWDSVRLTGQGDWVSALVNVAVSLAAGIGAATLGLALGSLT